MSLQALSSNFTASGSCAAFSSCMAGDFPPTCSVCGHFACQCALPVSIYNSSNPFNGTSGYTWTATWTCATCGQSVPFGCSHSCPTYIPYTPQPCIPNPSTFTFPALEPRECALCDKPLEVDEKKVCKGCKAVFEAWKFLTSKPEPEPEKEE